MSSSRTVFANGQPQQINSSLAPSGSFLLANNDILNPVYVGNSRSVSTGGSDVVQIPALGSLTFDGSGDLWVVTTGPAVQCFLIPGGTNWTPSPAQTAAQINALGLAKDTSVQQVKTSTDTVGTNTTGVAKDTTVAGTTTAVNAISGQFVSSSLYRTGTVNLTGGVSPVFINPAAIAPVALTGSGLTGAAVSFFSSYEISLLAIANAAATGIYTVILQWFNNVADTVPVDQITWSVPANTGAGVTILGRGPMRGNFLAVQVASNDAAGVTSTVAVNLTGSLRDAAGGDDWRGGGVMIGGNSSSAKAWTNQVLLSGNVAIGAGLTVNRDCLLYSGKASVFMENNATAGTLVATLAEILTGIELWRGAVAQSSTGGSPVLFDRMMPRSPVRLSVVNNGAALTNGFNAAIIADRI